MRRKASILIMAMAMVSATAPAALAGGNSGTAKVHPGHQGYLASGGQNINAAPVNHFAAHGGPGYAAGAGGWGSAVSNAAKTYKGLPNAHGN